MIPTNPNYTLFCLYRAAVRENMESTVLTNASVYFPVTSVFEPVAAACSVPFGQEQDFSNIWGMRSIFPLINHALPISWPAS